MGGKTPRRASCLSLLLWLSDIANSAVQPFWNLGIKDFDLSTDQRCHGRHTALKCLMRSPKNLFQCIYTKEQGNNFNLKSFFWETVLTNLLPLPPFFFLSGDWQKIVDLHLFRFRWTFTTWKNYTKTDSVQFELKHSKWYIETVDPKP